MKIALIDERMSGEAAEALAAYGYGIIRLSPANCLAPPVASHPDMILFPWNGELICHRKYAEAHPEIIDKIGRRIVQSDEPWREKYPGDVLFNAARLGGKVICRRKSISAEILNCGAEIIDVSQGYAGCSVCTVGEHALITADEGIAAAAGRSGINVLKIAPGHILLPGYDAGFIGGCAGCDGNRVFFTGDVSLHPDGRKMVDFIAAHGFEAVCLSRKPLTDYGKIIFV